MASESIKKMRTFFTLLFLAKDICPKGNIFGKLKVFVV